ITSADADEVIALSVRPTGLFSRPKLCAFSDIIDFDPKGVVIKSAKDLLPAGEIVRADKMLREKKLPWKSWVFDKTGRFFGKITDIVFVGKTGRVDRYFADGWLGRSHLISAKNVVELKKRRIIIEV
ncbi:MAG: hypothetical protein CEN88_163, partial [Candidatus Berkelbacteria bacterium Licking1014_2]